MLRRDSHTYAGETSMAGNDEEEAFYMWNSEGLAHCHIVLQRSARGVVQQNRVRIANLSLVVLVHVQEPSEGGNQLNR